MNSEKLIKNDSCIKNISSHRLKKMSAHIFENAYFWLGLLALTAVFTCSIPRSTYSSIIASTDAKDLPIYCVDCYDKEVAISFDCAWGDEDTDKILDILEEYDINATFFMTGSWVDAYPEHVLRIYEDGHDLGNHSKSHKHMPTIGYDEKINELDYVTEKIKDITGATPVLFRPPYGDYDNALISAARDAGYYTIQWDVDSLDWKNYGVKEMTDAVLNNKNLKTGSIVLMHNGAKYTAEALPGIIEGLQNLGYDIVPISDLIYEDNYYIDATGMQIEN